jgi:hypothetical protein
MDYSFARERRRDDVGRDRAQQCEPGEHRDEGVRQRGEQPTPEPNACALS